MIISEQQRRASLVDTNSNQRQIMQLDGGHFQELCDAYLTRLGYKNIHSLGTKPGPQIYQGCS